jgi:Na+-transporting NADH:ubiquinone oxidoreductase subunit B
MPAAVMLGAAAAGAVAMALGGLIGAALPAGIVLVLLVADPVTSAATTLAVG